MNSPTQRLLQTVIVSAVFTLSVGCVDDTWQPRVICHNANCKEPADPENDSLLFALDRSLELLDETTGRPPFDGIEIDTFWWSESDRCLMAHDLDHPDEATDALEAAGRLEQTLTQRTEDGTPITRHHDEFTVLIELKGHVTENKEDAHDEHQRRLHARCVVDMASLLIEGADTGGYDLEFIFMSFTPELLAEVAEAVDDEGLDATEHRIRLSALQGIRPPLDIQTLPLDEYPDDIGIDMVSTHPKWADGGDLQAYASRGWALGFWSFNLTPEVIDAVQRHRPDYVTTSHAPSFAGWLRQR